MVFNIFTDLCNFCREMLGILYWPVLPSLFSSLSSEGFCLSPTSLCVSFISPHYTFFLRRLHPVSLLQLKAQSRDLVNKTSSNPYFIQVIIKVPFLWMHNALTWQGTGLYLSPNLTVQPSLRSCPARQSLLYNAVSGVPVLQTPYLTPAQTSPSSLSPSSLPIQSGDGGYRIKKYVFPAFFSLRSHGHHLAQNLIISLILYHSNPSSTLLAI